MSTVLTQSSQTSLFNHKDDGDGSVGDILNRYSAMGKILESAWDVDSINANPRNVRGFKFWDADEGVKVSVKFRRSVVKGYVHYSYKAVFSKDGVKFGELSSPVAGSYKYDCVDLFMVMVGYFNSCDDLDSFQANWELREMVEQLVAELP